MDGFKKGGYFIMFFDLIKKFSSIDDCISLKVSYSNGVYGVDVLIGETEVYSFSSTDKLEIINRIDNFYNYLMDSDLFDKLLSDIEKEPLEV